MIRRGVLDGLGCQVSSLVNKRKKQKEGKLCPACGSLEFKILELGHPLVAFGYSEGGEVYRS